MKEWARRLRGYLIVLPVALAVGFGFHVYQAWTGNDSVPHRPVDVPKGQTRKFGPITVKLVSVSVKQPQPKTSTSFGADVPQDAVVVVAKFRARIDVSRFPKKLYCDAKIEDGEGWKWKSEFLSEPYVPKNVAVSCNGKYIGPGFKDVVPKPGQWYDFYNGYHVPKDKAKDLRPTLGRYQDHPHYLRFVS